MKNFYFYSLRPEPYKAIEEGDKTIEMRLNDEKRQQLKVGDFVIFTNSENKNKSLLIVVNELKEYPSFKELYEDVLDKLKLGYLENEVAKFEDMYAYYSKEKIERYHALAIHFKLIHFFKVNDKNHGDYNDLQEILGFDYLDNCLLLKNYNYLESEEEYKINLEEFSELHSYISLVGDSEAKSELKEREESFNKKLQDITNSIEREKYLVEKQKFLHFDLLNSPYKKNQEVTPKKKVDIAKKGDRFFLDDVISRDNTLYYSLKVVSDKKNRGLYILGTDYLYTLDDFSVIANSFIKDKYYVGSVLFNIKNADLYEK